MQLKSNAEVVAAIAQAHSVTGFAAATPVSADEVVACCAVMPAMYADVGAIPWAVLIALATQLLPIIFPDGSGGEWIQKLQAILTLISSIFTN